ncbi:MAG: hypothetical protein EOO02_12330 [Chitinophagaceae bacterium]|nr:MAG: hypothetical protein EOO02_12330 [Chitinophagaceae bacterium]
MKDIIHVETPDGEIVKPSEVIDRANDGTGKKEKTNDANDNASGPIPNADPRANSNIPDDAKGRPAEGAGSEVTDGEGG